MVFQLCDDLYYLVRPRRRLENFTRRGGHEGPFRRRILALEVITHLFHGDPFNSFVFVDILDEPMPTSVSRKIRGREKAFLRPWFFFFKAGEGATSLPFMHEEDVRPS